jgi:hypothetical protein
MHKPDPILDRVEREFNAVASLLVAGDADALVTACSALQHASVALAQRVVAKDAELQSSQFKARILNLAASMQSLRDNLARRTAFVDQSVAILFPVKPGPTYSAQGATSIRGLPRPRSFSG